MPHVWKEFNTLKVKTHLRVAFLTPKVFPTVYKTAKASSYFVSFLVSLSSGEKFSGPSCWKHSDSPLYPTPLCHSPPSLSCCHCLWTMSPPRGLHHLGTQRGSPLLLTLDSSCVQQTTKEIKEVASFVTKEYSKQKPVSLTSRPRE